MIVIVFFFAYTIAYVPQSSPGFNAAQGSGAGVAIAGIANAATTSTVVMKRIFDNPARWLARFTLLPMSHLPRIGSESLAFLVECASLYTPPLLRVDSELGNTASTCALCQELEPHRLVGSWPTYDKNVGNEGELTIFYHVEQDDVDSFLENCNVTPSRTKSPFWSRHSSTWIKSNTLPPHGR